MEYDLQQEEENPLRKVNYTDRGTEAHSEGQSDEFLWELTEEFNNDKLCDP